MMTRYARELRFELNGRPLDNGQVVEVTPREMYTIDIYGRLGTSFDRPSYPDGEGPFVLRPEFATEIISPGLIRPIIRMEPEDGVTTSVIFPNMHRENEQSLLGSFNVMLNIEDTVWATFIIQWVVLNASNEPVGDPVYYNTPLQLWFRPPSPPAIVVLGPYSISLRDESDNRVDDIIQMEGGTSRTFRVFVDDHNRNGDIDIGDFFLASPPVTYETQVFFQGSDPNIDVSSSPPLDLIQLADNIRVPRELATVRVSARNVRVGQTGAQEGGHAYDAFSWRLSYPGANEGTNTIATQSISVRVAPGDDAGGTCNAAGLGFLALLLPLVSLVFIRKKK
jgi:hypothetical protein